MLPAVAEAVADRDRAESLARRVTVGIVTALPEERAAMLAMLEGPVSWSAAVRGAGRAYDLGEITAQDGGRHVVALALAGMGNNLVVECKNGRANKVDQEAVTKLVGELSLHNMKQGFLLATGEFTSDAVQQARYASAQDVEVVLIDGQTITDFLGGLRPVSDLLVELHRRQILRAG